MIVIESEKTFLYVLLSGFWCGVVEVNDSEDVTEEECICRMHTSATEAM